MNRLALRRMSKMSHSIKETIDYISSTPGSFALVRSTEHWPLPKSLRSSPAEASSSSATSGLAPTAPSANFRKAGSTHRRRVHIAVLDSSFNPPTLAHQAIAFSSFPPPTPTSTTKPSTLPSEGLSQAETQDGPSDYNARLLLFSARNVEKTLKSTDATPEQRVEMMSILSSIRQQTSPDESVGVGLINEPTFVGKAAIIRSFLASLPYLKGKGKGKDGKADEDGEMEVEVDISFLVGTDTLVRFFDPRFYPPGEMGSKIEEYFASYRTTPTQSSESAVEGENGNTGGHAKSASRGSGAYLVSARRGHDPTDRALEEEILNREGISRWTQAGKVRLLGTGHEGWEEISSTRVREAVQSDNWELVEELVGKETEEYIRKEGFYTSK
ncbi:hypothetical protein IAU59_003296 [Kwoniella sp. CBS 9459]